MSQMADMGDWFEFGSRGQIRMPNTQITAALSPLTLGHPRRDNVAIPPPKIESFFREAALGAGVHVP